MTDSEPWSYHRDGSPVYSPAAGCAPATADPSTRGRLAHFKCPVGVSFFPSLARAASGKFRKQAIRASPTTPAVP